jgi:hypothetical protein
MIIKYWFVTVIVIVISRTEFAQTYETLEQKSADILLQLSLKDSAAYKTIEEMAEILKENISSASLDNGNSNHNEHELSLKDSFDEFYFLHKNISFDSSLVLFNEWYLKLNNFYYDFTVERFYSSAKTKILFFSTSMSCYCTLEMCKNQLIDILNLVRSSNGTYDYLVIDTYEKDELPLKYETLFVPSVIVFDKANKLLFKIQYDEKMISNLNNYLTEQFEEEL